MNDSADSTLAAFEPVDTRLLELVHDDVPADQATAGRPRTGSVPLGSVGTARFGVWELTAGAMRDIEVNEVFVVVDGEATVVLLDGDVEVSKIRLRPGILCRLAAGSSTRWDVPDVLRKVYLLEPDASGA